MVIFPFAPRACEWQMGCNPVEYREDGSGKVPHRVHNTAPETRHLGGGRYIEFFSNRKHEKGSDWMPPSILCFNTAEQNIRSTQA